MQKSNTPMQKKEQKNIEKEEVASKKQEEDVVQLYQTTNLYMSAWFKMNGLELKGINRSNPKRLVFLFEDSEKRKKLFDDFWKQEQIQRFISFMQDMKVEMYAENPPIIFNKK